MYYLGFSLIIWSLSFSLIANYLSGHVDDWFAVLMRIGLGFLLFLPFLRFRGYRLSQIAGYMSVGALQLGLMYLFYYPAYHYLSVPELLLFTVTTPIYITFIYDLLSSRPWRIGYLCSASLAVAGAIVLRYSQINPHFWHGLILIQLANICFALGQVGYKRLMEVSPMPQNQAFVWFYAGALCVALVGWLLYGNPQHLPTTTTQWVILLWLGIVASGIGFYTWNKGVSQVDAGMLAIMNNMLIPVSLVINIVFWHQSFDWNRLVIGGGLIFSALWVHRYWVQPRNG